MTTNDGTTEPGPWPEPDEADTRAEAERIGAQAAAVADDLDAASDRVVDHLDDIDDSIASWDERTEPRGSKGVSLVVVGLNLGFLLALPVMVIVGIYTFLTVYAIVKTVSSGSDAADPSIVLVGVVGLVTVFTLVLGVGTWAIGRMADPKKRRS